MFQLTTEQRWIEVVADFKDLFWLSGTSTSTERIFLLMNANGHRKLLRNSSSKLRISKNITLMASVSCVC